MDAREIKDEEVFAADRALINLRNKNPQLSFPTDIEKAKLREVADYLNDPNPLGNEIEAWDRLRKGNYYGYCIYVHEANEIQSIKSFTQDPGNEKYYGLNLYQGNSVPEIRKVSHGKGCFEQYKLLRDYLLNNYGVQEQKLTQLYYCNSWDMVVYDSKGANKFSDYLRSNEKDWYNKYSEKYPWRRDRSLMIVFEEMRGENGG